MSDDDNHYKKTKTRLLNNRFIVITLLIVAVISGISSLSDSFSTLDKNIGKLFYSKPQFTTAYHEIAGHALPLLLEGKLDGTMKELYGATPIIVKNEVYKDLQFLYKKFSLSKEKNSSSSFFTSSDMGFNPSMKGIGTTREMREIPGSYTHDRPDEGPADWNKTKLKAPYNNLGEYWNPHLVFHPNYGEPDDITETAQLDLHKGIIDSHHIYFDKPFTYHQISPLLGTQKDIFNYLLKEYEKPFFDVGVHYSICSDNGWEVYISHPVLHITLLMVKSTENQTMHITDVTGHLKNPERITDNIDAFPVTSDVHDTYGSGMVEANQVLVIPIGLYYSWGNDPVEEGIDDDYRDPIDDIDYAVFDGNLTKVHIQNPNPQVEETCKICYGIIDAPQYSIDLNLTVEQLAQKLKETRYDEWDFQDNRFYLSQLTIDAMNIDGKSQIIRPEPKGTFIISEGKEYGCCPYLFTQNGKALGKFLSGRNSAAKQGIYRKKLRVITSDYVIREIEDETTHINWVRLSCMQHSNGEEIILPVDTRLHDNNQSLILHKGDSYQLRFDIEPELYKECTMQTHGYYEPQTSSQP